MSTIQILLTVLAGVIVFFFSQIILKYLIEPVSDYRKLRSQISIQLVYYANIYSNPTEYNEDSRQDEKLVNKLDEVSTIFRKLASELIGVVNIIPLYRLFAFIRLVPKRDKILEASSNLIGLSNSMWAYSPTLEDRLIDSNIRRKEDIMAALKIKSS